MKIGVGNSMVRLALTSVCVVLLAAGPTASSEAGRQPVLVELFTSESCSSCPPADALLTRLDSQQFVAGGQAIVLSEHVTYWDDLGWKDPFSKPELTERQRRYGSQFRLEGPYTPQMVVNGRWELVGSDVHALTRAVQQAAAEERTHPPIDIRIENLHVDRNSLRAVISTGSGQPARLLAVLAADSALTHVRNGENAGKLLGHVAVVRSLVEIARVEAPLRGFALKLPLAADTAEKNRLILFLQDEKTGWIMGSIQIPFERPKAGL
jgi:hypothetical protein